MGGKIQRIIVDRAASVSVVSEDFWNSTSAQDRTLRKHVGPEVRVGDNRKQSIMGMGTIYFQLQCNPKKKFKVDAIIVKNWMHDILLSVKWFREHKAVLDLEKDMIKIDGETVKLSIRGKTEHFLNMIEKQKKRNWITSAENIELPAQSRQMIDIDLITDDVLDNGDYWIENEGADIDQHVRVTRGPYKLDRDKPILLFVENRSNIDRTIDKGDIIGTIEKAKFQSTDEDKPINNKINDELKNNIDEIFKDLGIDKIEGIKSKTRRDLKRTVMRRIKVFSTKNLMFENVKSKIGRVKHKINTGEARPILQRTWRTPQTYQKVIRDNIDEMLRCGVIRPGS